MLNPLTSTTFLSRVKEIESGGGGGRGVLLVSGGEDGFYRRDFECACACNHFLYSVLTSYL